MSIQENIKKVINFMFINFDCKCYNIVVYFNNFVFLIPLNILFYKNYYYLNTFSSIFLF